MLDNLRFQEVEKAIFRAKEAIYYGNHCITKGEPFIIIDGAVISNFKVESRDISSGGRSTEYADSTISGVSFNLTDGRIKLDLFNSIYGENKKSQPVTYTVSETALVENTNELLLPSEPYGKVILYLTDDYGNSAKIAENQYTIENNKIVFIKEVNHLITYVYETSVESKCSNSIRQLGQNIVGTLEMQCIALDVITEEKIRVLLKFNKVSVSTDLSINFNNSLQASGSVIYVRGLPEDNQSIINKEIFTIDVI